MSIQDRLKAILEDYDWDDALAHEPFLFDTPYGKVTAKEWNERARELRYHEWIESGGWEHSAEFGVGGWGRRLDDIDIDVEQG